MDILKEGIVNGKNKKVKVMNNTFKLKGEESKVTISHKTKLAANHCQLIKVEVQDNKNNIIIFNP